MELDEDGAPVVDPRTLRCSGAAVFVAGDAEGSRPVLHEAHAQGAAAGAAAADPQAPTAYAPATTLAITYTDPDMASVGEGLEDIGEGALVGEARFEEGRCTLEDRPEGLIRLYAHCDGRLAGAEMVGADVEHLAQRAADWITRGLSVEDALAQPFYHPTLDEDLQAALQDLNSRSPAAGTSSG